MNEPQDAGKAAKPRKEPKPAVAASAPPAPEKGQEMLAFAELLEEIKATDMITYSMLNGAYAEMFPDKIKIYINPMGYLMLATDKSKTETIARIASKILGMPVRVEYERMAAGSTDERTDLSDL